MHSVEQKAEDDTHIAIALNAARLLGILELHRHPSSDGEGGVPLELRTRTC